MESARPLRGASLSGGLERPKASIVFTESVQDSLFGRGTHRGETKAHESDKSLITSVRDDRRSGFFNVRVGPGAGVEISEDCGILSPKHTARARRRRLLEHGYAHAVLLARLCHSGRRRCLAGAPMGILIRR